MPTLFKMRTMAAFTDHSIIVTDYPFFKCANQKNASIDSSIEPL